MKSFIKIEKESALRGKVVINYNLRYLLLLLIGIVGGAVIGLLGYGLWLLLCLLWSIKWWVLGAAGVAALACAIWYAIKHWPKSTAKPQSDKQKNYKWLWWLPVLLACLIGGIWLLRSCNSTEPNTGDDEIEVVYNKSFDYVVTSRAYLDGVQDSQPQTTRALVGFKFINGQPVQNMSFEGKTYEEAVDVVADDWRPLFINNVNANLSEQQMTALVLFAMRNGQYGFLKSDFLREVNAGNVSTASKHMAIHKADGSKRVLGNEAKQYIYILQLLWDNKLSVDECLDMPMFSYRKLNADSLYDANGNYIFNDSIKNVLKSGNYPTPRQALEL